MPMIPWLGEARGAQTEREVTQTRRCSDQTAEIVLGFCHHCPPGTPEPLGTLIILLIE
jgi:hypothetical protein